jgi:lipoprotein-anchoring transpeptidase ErfK/SrfK
MLVTACGSKKDRDKAAPTAAPAPEPGASPTDPVPVVVPDFPDGTRSIQLTRTIPVRLDPADDGKRIGTVAVDTRVGWTRTAQGKGCNKPWVEIQPRGWICGEHVKPTKLAPFGREVPMLDRGEIVPGIYGRLQGTNLTTYALQQPEPAKKPAKGKPDPKKGGPVTSPRELEAASPPAKEPRMVEDKPIIGTLTLRQYEELTVGGKVYWKISRGNEYVLKSNVKLLTPSQFMGSRLGDDTGWALPIAFVWPRHGWQQAWTYHKPNAIVNKQVPARTPVPILEVATKDDKPIAYRIGPEQWMHPADLRIFEPTAPPPLLKPNERWIDIDLDKQILVAFEGELAVYATLISSGTTQTPTQTGLYRVWLKESESDMKNLKAEDPYSVATVPWTQFFYPEDDLALHTAYWHDGFGKPRSHGCVNLAPRDARWLYYWSDPQVPPGWTMTTGVVELPGSVVRVRSAADPNPEWKGYAKKVVEARQSNRPI